MLHPQFMMIFEQLGPVLKPKRKSYCKPDLMGTQPRWSKQKSEESTSASLLEMCKPEDTAPAK